MQQVDTPGKKALVGIAFGYLGVVLFLPALNVFYQAFRNGVGPFLYHLTDPDFLQAVRLPFLLLTKPWQLPYHQSTTLNGFAADIGNF